MQRSAILGHFAIVLCMSLAGACGDAGDNASRPIVPRDTAEFAGLYDVHVEYPAGGFDAHVVGEATGRGDELNLTLFPPGVESVTVAGKVRRDGSLVVTDAFASESDFAFTVVADVHVRRAAGVLQIAGSIRPADARDQDLLAVLTFEMQRSIGARADAFSGVWRFVFPESPGVCRCVSHTQVSLVVSPDGHGSSSAAAETDENDGQVGFLHAGSVLASPEGRVRITMVYGTPDESSCAVGVIPSEVQPPCRVTLTGMLLRQKDRAAGTYLLRLPDFDIPFGGVHAWSAMRMSDPPAP